MIECCYHLLGVVSPLDGSLSLSLNYHSALAREGFSASLADVIDSAAPTGGALHNCRSPLHLETLGNAGLNDISEAS